MAYRKGTKNFYAEVESSVRTAFQKQWKKRKQSNNDATTAALKLWLSLPTEVQAMLISCPEIDVQDVCQHLGHRLREALHKTLTLEEQYQNTPAGE